MTALTLLTRSDNKRKGMKWQPPTPPTFTPKKNKHGMWPEHCFCPLSREWRGEVDLIALQCEIHKAKIQLDLTQHGNRTTTTTTTTKEIQYLKQIITKKNQSMAMWWTSSEPTTFVCACFWSVYACWKQASAQNVKSEIYTTFYCQLKSAHWYYQRSS